MSVRLKMNFGPKHQLLRDHYHSNGLYLSFYVSNKRLARQSFCSISQTFPIILSYHILFYYYYYFFDFGNQSVAGNVIQLNKEKA